MDRLIVKKINLRPGEEVVSVARRYGLTFWPQILAVFLLLTLPFFFLFPLFQLGFLGILFFLFLIVLGIIYGLRVIIIWYFNVFVITNQRIIDIDQRGFFERIVSEAPFEKIQDVSYRLKGIWQTLLHYGAVRIQTAGATAELEICDIKNPEQMQELIVNLSRVGKKENKSAAREAEWMEIPAPSDEEFKIIKSSIEDLDEKQLEELEIATRNRLRQMKLKRLEQITNDE